jgi:hypothetical protein
VAAKATARPCLWRVAGWAVLAASAMIAIGLVLFAALSSSTPAELNRGAEWASILSVPVAVAGVVPIFVERIRERAKERTRTALDNEVRDVVKTTETALKPDDVQELVQRLDKSIDVDLARVAALTGSVRRRMRQRIISNTELRAELDRAVLEVLPLSPRAAKRMFNHAHLLLDIGVERGIFDTQPRLQPRQLAAWVGLNERWPSVAAAITSDPTLLGSVHSRV